MIKNTSPQGLPARRRPFTNNIAEGNNIACSLFTTYGKMELGL